MSVLSDNRVSSPKAGGLLWLVIGGSALTTAILFFRSLVVMESFWHGQEAYSYGYLIPVIVVYLLWQRKDQLAATAFTGSWMGAALVFFGVVLFFLSELATVPILAQYAFVIVVIGIAYSFLGTAALRIVLIPLLLLVFMIPLPQFLFNNLSTKLQLLSSDLGVAIIRLFGISVFLQGNVIDLGAYKLQVVEACSGLRYLFPLASFGFICAYLFKAPMWQRAIVFLSTIPITVLMNSFRIGVIGVMANTGEGRWPRGSCMILKVGQSSWHALRCCLRKCGCLRG